MRQDVPQTDPTPLNPSDDQAVSEGKGRRPAWKRAVSWVLLRDTFNTTSHRTHLTRAIQTRINHLDGIVIDIGGGRHASHDASWPTSATRFSVDIATSDSTHVRADALHLPFRSGSVDVIAMVELLEHVSEPRRALEEAHRVLRESGVLVGSVPFLYPIHADPNDYFRYTEDGLRELTRGWREVTIAPHGNALSAAWITLTFGSHFAKVFNPLARRFGRRASRVAPTGYTFVAKA